LPQEIDRDKTAIHFNKGCYLGQETVARLDALGHVNRILMGFIWEPSIQSITPESAINQVILNQMEQQVGEIRSATIGPKAGQILGLAMIRIKSLELSPYISEDPRGSLNFMKLEEFRTQFQSVE
jgi:folate-binding Fe-S cluster repair protein YgfZ